jgi:putative membrane protein (TIGR04086 family)
MNMLVLKNCLANRMYSFFEHTLCHSICIREGENRMDTRKMFSAVVYGVLTILVIVLTCSVIFSLLLRFTNLQESSLQWLVMALSFFALFAGGFISGGKGKEKGWLMGGSTAIIFTCIVLLYQYLGQESGFTLEQTFYHLGYLATAVLGGIMGVNISGVRTN